MFTLAAYFGLTALYLMLFFFLMKRPASRWGGAAGMGASLALMGVGTPALLYVAGWEIARHSVGDTSEGPISLFFFSAMVIPVGLLALAVLPSAASIGMLVLDRHPRWVTSVLARPLWERVLIFIAPPLLLGVFTIVASR